MPSVAGPVEFDRDERRIFHLDPAALRRSLQPPTAVLFAAQHTGEQTDQFLSINRAAAIKPRTVTLDQEGQIPALGRHARWLGSSNPVHAGAKFLIRRGFRRFRGNDIGGRTRVVHLAVSMEDELPNQCGI